MSGWIDEPTGITFAYRSSNGRLHRYDVWYPGAPVILCESDGAPIEFGKLEGLAELLIDEVLEAWGRLCVAERAAYVAWLRERGHRPLASSIPLTAAEIAKHEAELQILRPLRAAMKLRRHEIDLAELQSSSASGWTPETTREAFRLAWADGSGDKESSEFLDRHINDAYAPFRAGFGGWNWTRLDKHGEPDYRALHYPHLSLAIGPDDDLDAWTDASTRWAKDVLEAVPEIEHVELDVHEDGHHANGIPQVIIRRDGTASLSLTRYSSTMPLVEGSIRDVLADTQARFRHTH